MVLRRFVVLTAVTTTRAISHEVTASENRVLIGASEGAMMAGAAVLAGAAEGAGLPPVLPGSAEGAGLPPVPEPPAELPAKEDDAGREPPAELQTAFRQHQFDTVTDDDNSTDNSTSAGEPPAEPELSTLSEVTASESSIRAHEFDALKNVAEPTAAVAESAARLFLRGGGKANNANLGTDQEGEESGTGDTSGTSFASTENNARLKKNVKHAAGLVAVAIDALNKAVSIHESAQTFDASNLATVESTSLALEEAQTALLAAQEAHSNAETQLEQVKALKLVREQTLQDKENHLLDTESVVKQAKGSLKTAQELYAKSQAAVADAESNVANKTSALESAKANHAVAEELAEGTGNKTDAASNQGNSSMEAANNESNVVALVRTGNTLTETAGNGNETDDDMMEEMNNDTNANNESNVVAKFKSFFGLKK